MGHSAWHMQRAPDFQRGKEGSRGSVRGRKHQTRSPIKLELSYCVVLQCSTSSQPAHKTHADAAEQNGSRGGDGFDKNADVVDALIEEE